MRSQRYFVNSLIFVASFIMSFVVVIRFFLTHEAAESIKKIKRDCQVVNLQNKGLAFRLSLSFRSEPRIN